MRFLLKYPLALTSSTSRIRLTDQTLLFICKETKSLIGASVACVERGAVADLDFN